MLAGRRGILLSQLRVQSFYLPSKAFPGQRLGLQEQDCVAVSRWGRGVPALDPTSNSQENAPFFQCPLALSPVATLPLVLPGQPPCTHTHTHTHKPAFWAQSLSVNMNHGATQVCSQGPRPTPRDKEAPHPKITGLWGTSPAEFPCNLLYNLPTSGNCCRSQVSESPVTPSYRRSVGRIRLQELFLPISPVFALESLCEQAALGML